eukprot:3834326-Pyramimonas_sp.AAC.1
MPGQASPGKLPPCGSSAGSADAEVHAARRTHRASVGTYAALILDVCAWQVPRHIHSIVPYLGSA